MAGKTTELDTRLILALRSALPDVTSPMRAVSFTATGYGAIPVAIVLGVLLGRLKDRRLAWLYVIACLSGWMVELALKESIHRVRPHDISPKLTDAGWYSFPSGHAMMAILVFGFGAVLLARLLPRPWRAVVVVAGALLTAGVGLSRIYLGAHWPSDVLAGWVAGAGWAAVSVAWDQRRARRA